MDEKERKEVAVSEQFTTDLESVYEYGEEIFGAAAAKSFVSEIYSKIWSLDQTWTPRTVGVVTYLQMIIDIEILF